MSDLRDLYQSVILDHNRAPRNYGALPDATSQADGHNPLCGDSVTVWVKLVDGRVADIKFVGEGCAISKASASLMTQVVKGQAEDAVVGLIERFHAALTATGSAEPSTERLDPALQRLAPLTGVSRYPERVKCATLAWHALRAALEGGGASGQAPPKTRVA